MEKVRSVLRRLMRRVGRRGGVLIIFGLIDLGISLSLFTAPVGVVESASYRSLANFMPIEVWAVIWCVVGLVNIGQAFSKKDTMAYVSSASVKALFGFQYLMAWAFAGSERGWVMAVIFGLLSVLMVILSGWPEVTKVLLTAREKDAVLEVDCGGLITFWNRQAEDLFGWSSDEIVGKPVSVLMPDRYKDRHQRGIDRLRRTGISSITGSILHVEGKHRNGDEFPIELVVSVSGTGDHMKLGGVIRPM